MAEVVDAHLGVDLRLNPVAEKSEIAPQRCPQECDAAQLDLLILEHMNIGPLGHLLELASKAREGVMVKLVVAQHINHRRLPAGLQHPPHSHLPDANVPGQHQDIRPRAWQLKWREFQVQVAENLQTHSP